MSCSISKPPTWTVGPLLTQIIDLCSQHTSLVLRIGCFRDKPDELNIWPDRLWGKASWPLLSVPISSFAKMPSSNSSGYPDTESIPAKFWSTIQCLESLLDSATDEEIRTWTPYVNGITSRLSRLSSRLCLKVGYAQARSQKDGLSNTDVETPQTRKKCSCGNEKNFTNRTCGRFCIHDAY